jgi:SOS response regulatory protein OraA/RecX
VFLVLKDDKTERFLEAGAVLDESDLEELQGPLTRAAGIAVAFRLLSGRDRTEQEIKRALSKYGVRAPDVVTEIIETLRRQGYLNDRRLASNFIRYTMEHRPAGPYLLRRKLERVGIDKEVIETELRTAFGAGREREIAQALARRKLTKRMGSERAVRNVHGFLTRRGFSSSIVNDICARILSREIVGENDEHGDTVGA